MRSTHVSIEGLGVKSPSPPSISCSEAAPQPQSEGPGLSDSQIVAPGAVSTGAVAVNILQFLEDMSVQ